MADNELERIYTIPLRKVKQGSSNKAANRAVREVRSYLSKHMKSDDVWIDDAVNQVLWRNGMYKVPSKIRVRAIKFEDGVVEVSLPDEDATTSIRERLREERESKTPILPTPGAEDEEADEEGEEPAETAEIEAEPEGDDETVTRGAAEGNIEAEPEGEAETVTQGGPEGDIEAEPDGDDETVTRGSAGGNIEAEPETAPQKEPAAEAEPAADTTDEADADEKPSA